MPKTTLRRGRKKKRKKIALPYCNPSEGMLYYAASRAIKVVANGTTRTRTSKDKDNEYDYQQDVPFRQDCL